VGLLAANAFALIAIALAAYATDVFKDLELDTVDARFAIRGERPAPPDLLVVAIDDVTFNRLGVRWPFPRRLHARAIDRLRRAGAKAIAYDVQFTEPTTEADDNALIDAVQRAGNVVLATTEVDARGRSQVFGGSDVVRQIGARDADALLPNDPGGVLRRVGHDVHGLDSFAVAAAEVADRHSIADRGFPAWIDYAGPPRTIRTVSFSTLLTGRVPAGLIRGRVVVVGPAAPSLQDIHPTPTAREDLMAGAEIQANAIDTVRRGLPLSRTGRWLDICLILLLGLVGPAAGLRLGALRAALIGVATAALFAVGVQLAFNSGAIVSFTYPLLALVLGVVGSLALGVIVGAFERERMRDLFSRFVPEPVVDEVLARAGAEGLRLGGVRRTATVLFSDIRGFTQFAESRSPDVVIDFLNQYLSAMSDVILDHGGTLVAYMGDGIMSVFGAPIEQDDHADRAVAAAREMAGPTLARFNAWAAGHGHAEPFRIGIGINSGPVMSGNVGSERRLEYTAIGDTTNTAARLEGMTKGSEHMVFIADATRALLTREDRDLVDAGEHPVRGRSETIRIWSLGG
jgi:adenylate cyclase